MSWFIHIPDPGFPDPPYAGGRRLGPFLSPEEALEQAVSDMAGGAYVAAGVYEEAESERWRDAESPRMKATFSAAEVARRASKRAAEAHARLLSEQAEFTAQLESVLPAGVSVADLEAAGWKAPT